MSSTAEDSFELFAPLRPRFLNCTLRVADTPKREDEETAEGENVILCEGRSQSIVCPFPESWNPAIQAALRRGMTVAELMDCYQQPQDESDPLWDMRHLFQMACATFAKMSKRVLMGFDAHHTSRLKHLAGVYAGRMQVKLSLMPLDAAFVCYMIKDMHASDVAAVA